MFFPSIFFAKLSLLNFEYSKLQGYAIYCEVPPQVLDQLKQYLQEGKVLYICNACVERAKPGFRVVDTPYILKLIMRTQIFEGNSNDTTFPKYVFSLTPIEMLPQYARRTDRFLGKKNCLHIFILALHLIRTCSLNILGYHNLLVFLECRCHWKNHCHLKCSCST